MPLHIYNHTAGTKQPFAPIHPGKVGLYVCGMTVQDIPHVGHMFAFVACDMIRRYLEHLGYQVTHVQNFTDIDDKIITKAQEEGVDPAALAERNITAYHEAARQLGIQPAHHYPRVTEHIPEIVAYIEQLIARGHAYVAAADTGAAAGDTATVRGTTTPTDVYFDVRSWPAYGQLSGRNVDELRTGARIEPTAEKRDPVDFALWKSAKPDEPAWDSPWGRGRPGWHIECSVMATKYLGDHIDLHGGGRDLIFPHHENEQAQACACTDGPYVNYWLHNGLLQLGDRKMSKSDGNFFAVADVLQKFRPEVVRFFLLSAHFRSQLAYGEPRLRAAATGYDRLRNGAAAIVAALATTNLPNPIPDGLISAPGATLTRQVDTHRQAFFAAMDDDFNSGGAIGALFGLLRAVNQYLAETEGRYLDLAPLRNAHDLLAQADEILGLFPGGLDALTPSAPKVPAEIEQLLNERQQAREQKNWAEADRLRDRIATLGYTVTDTPQGPRITQTAAAD